MTSSTDRFREQLATYRATSEPEPVDLRPASAFEAVTRQMVESMADELREIRNRLNSLLFMMAGAIVLDVVSRLTGQ
jgi:BMFP domain-containing protein YqiC